MDAKLRVRRLCDRQWADLEGDDTRRFCDGCQKFVYNVEALPRTDIDRLRRAGQFCATYLGDDDGAYVLPAGASPASARSATTVAGALLFAALGVCAAAEPTAPPVATADKPAATASQDASEVDKPDNAKDAADQRDAEAQQEQERMRERLRYLGQVE
jgi:hypothetical protein